MFINLPNVRIKILFYKYNPITNCYLRVKQHFVEQDGPATGYFGIGVCPAV